MDILADEAEDIPDQVGRAQQARRLAAIIVSRLGRRERQILQLRYGFGGVERRTQREIAHQLGISRSYVSRIEMDSAYPAISFLLGPQQIAGRGARA